MPDNPIETGNVNPFTVHPELLAGTNETALAWLLEEVEQPDTRLVTMARLREELPPMLYAGLRLSFLGAKAMSASPEPGDRIFAEEVADTQAALAGGGFALHTPERQALLEEMAPALQWTQELLTAVKRIGVPIKPRWERSGIEHEPTTELVEAWRAAKEAELAAEAAEEQRQRDYLDLRNWAVRLTGPMLHSLEQKRQAGEPAPTKAELLSTLSGE